jgi:hypothetical protein
LAKKRTDKPTTAPAPPPLNVDDITDSAYAKFSARAQQDISRDDVRAVVAELDLGKLRPVRHAPRLVVRRLRFTGAKKLTGQQKPSAINYDQEFATGVNVILIQHNLVGKSSILKTIKFALTGDDDDYDADVREWIREIWLQFTLDDREYTILLARRDDGLHGMLVPGRKECPIEEVPATESALGFYNKGTDEIQAGLKDFFVKEFSLASLGWMMAHPSGDGRSSECWASWRTFFQALRIPDDNHTYLLCKPDPGVANQEQLLFSAFLGLHLMEPLNKLSMEASSIRKSAAARAGDGEKSAERKSELTRQRRELQTELDALDGDLQRRLAVLLGGDLSRQIVEAEETLAASETEHRLLSEQLQNLTTQIRHQRANARRLREQIALSGELSGIEVKLCPHCTQGIEQAAVEREKRARQCRLCAKQVPQAPEDEAEILEAAAVQCEERADELQATYEEVSAQIASARVAVEAARRSAEAARRPPTGGVTADSLRQENERRGALNRQIGAIDQEVSTLNRPTQPGGDDPDKRAKIIEKVQLILKGEAEQRNSAIQRRLNELAQPIIAALRADEISGVTCSPMGVVRLTKGEKPTAFGKIMNPGERFRAKLALFLAMMHLGCEAGFGRHPGFLLIDQLGGPEMVPPDLRKSAEALKEIDDNFGDKVQIICCTARPEFEGATAEEKIYGPTESGPGDKEYAF